MPERSAQGGERFSAPELQPGAPQAPAGSPPSAVPAPAAPPPVVDPMAAAMAADVPAGTPNPAAAADQDVIEKEWVDRAQEVIDQTAGDPHAEEEAVEDLQIDYMQKRYGKSVKKSND